MTTQQTGPKFARPVHEVRIGLVRGSVWANRGEHGACYHVTFDRSYRHGGEWKKATSFGRYDLLTLAKVASEVHSWIAQHGVGGKTGSLARRPEGRGLSGPSRFWSAKRPSSETQTAMRDPTANPRGVGSRANA